MLPNKNDQKWLHIRFILYVGLVHIFITVCWHVVHFLQTFCYIEVQCLHMGIVHVYGTYIHFISSRIIKSVTAWKVTKKNWHKKVVLFQYHFLPYTAYVILLCVSLNLCAELVFSAAFACKIDLHVAFTWKTYCIYEHVSLHSCICLQGFTVLMHLFASYPLLMLNETVT